MKIKTLADCKPDGTPRCYHCEKKFPKTAKAEHLGKHVIVYCPSCGCMTPFPVSE